LGTSSKRSIILMHAVHDCPGGSIGAVARYVRFAQITCILLLGSQFF